MRLALESDHGLIRTVDGQAIAVLNKGSFRALSPCMTGQGFRVDVWILVAEWQTKAAEAQCLQTNDRKTVRMKADLILFGPRDAGGHVAADLGSCQNYLQQPHIGLFFCPYENPQSLQVPDPPPRTKEADETLSALLRIEEPDETQDKLEEDRDRDSTQLADLITDINAFFDRFPTNWSATMGSTDCRILSSLFT